MSSDAATEPHPKGQVHAVALQLVLELSCAIVSVCKVKLNYLEPKCSHEFFGSGEWAVAPLCTLEDGPVFGASPPLCAPSVRWLLEPRFVAHLKVSRLRRTCLSLTIQFARVR